MTICVEQDWMKLNDIVAKHIAEDDIANFICWDVVRYTMFDGATSVPIKYLQSLPDWDKWEKAIVESPVGNPRLHKSYPQSSGNLINHAYHLHQFLSKTECKLKNLNKILEFGAGYGCMCRLIHNLGFSGEYVAMDLPALLYLQHYYLGETVYGRITFLSEENDFIKQMSEDESLFIANWSISEISYPMRQRILDSLRTKYVFITFQEKHNDFDNKDFFDKFIEKDTRYEWFYYQIPFSNPSIKHYYLFGRRHSGEEDAEQECRLFRDMTKDDRFEFCLTSKYKKEIEPKKIDAHYVYHTAWAARVLSRTKPEKHVDISSSVYFNTMVSAFVPIDFYEYHPLELELSGLQTEYADLVSLPFADSSLPSLSCMHVVEHIGLGRYGELLDPEGDLKAISELKRVLAGNLLFVVPVGKPMIFFNLHRIYSYDQIMSYFSELMLVEFTLVSDGGVIFENANKEIADKQNYGCGCFWFRKGMK